MKNFLFFILLVTLIPVCEIQSQSLTQQQKDSIIIDLYSDRWYKVQNACESIISYRIYEAVPILQNIIWEKENRSRLSFVEALYGLQFGGTNEYALALFDSLQKNTYSESDSVGMKIRLLYFLIKLGNFSKLDYLYYNTTLPDKPSKRSTIELWAILMNVPEYELIAKEKLLFLLNESINGDDRYSALYWLGLKYKKEITPIVIQRYNEEDNFKVKTFILHDYFPLGDIQIVTNILRENLITEKNGLILNDIFNYLLDSLNTPYNYQFLKSWLYDESNDWEMKGIKKDWIEFGKEYHPFIPDSLIPIFIIIDSTSSYVIQSKNFSWLEDSIFVNDLITILTTAKTNLQNGDSLACRVQVKAFQDLVDNVYKDSLNTDPRFVTIEGWKFLYWNAQYILDRLPEPPANPNLLVNLKNSLGNQIPASNVQYYENSWKDAVNNGDGTFTVITTRPTVSIRVYYEYASLQADNVPAQNNTYTFTTVNATVQLKNSLGNLIDVGTVQYYAGAWRNFGTTSNGVAYKELLPVNYSFRMTYEYGSIDKQQNLSSDPTVIFQTVNASVQLKNSLGNLIDVGTVQYYSGAWRTFGTTSNGVAYKELLPINYSFRMTYEYGSIDKQQNLSADPTVVFQTVNAAVQLKNSLGNFIDAGTVQYYAGAWRSFGTTSNGVAYKELLPINYSFRMTYEYVSKDKQQNLSTNPIVDFSTVLCSVKVSKSSNNQPINNAAVKYYAGAWRNLGTTNSDGITTKELLPSNISFRATVGNVSLDKQQDISVNNLVEILLNVP